MGIMHFRKATVMTADSAGGVEPTDRHRQQRRATAGSTDPLILNGPRKWVLMGSISFTLFILYVLYAGIIKVFLPNQVADIDPANKINNLAGILALMSIATTIATPLSGALSDRLRTRWGRRAPFIAIGSLAAALLTFGLSFATTLVAITILWVMAAFCYNMMQVPMTTLIADRFAPDDRGKASGLLGAGQNIGTSVGVIVAGYLVVNLQLGYVLYGAAVLSCCIAFILVNREPSSLHMEREPLRLGHFIRGFWISPREHPDFAWAFISRFALYMGFTLITTYMLYILQDYIGLSRSEANAAIGRIFAIQLVGLLLSGVFSGFLSDRLGRRKPFVIQATILIAAAYAMPLLMPTMTGMYLYAGIVGIGYGAYTAVDMALMTQVLPKGGKSAGKDLGILIIALNIPLILGPVLAALILNISGNSYATLFTVAATLVAFSALLVLPIRSVR